MDFTTAFYQKNLLQTIDKEITYLFGNINLSSLFINSNWSQKTKKPITNELDQ